MYNNPIMIGFGMAKKDQKRFYPVERNLLFEKGTSNALYIADVNKGLSAQNRRLYRQNRVYSVKVDAVGCEAQMLDVYRLRDTFMLQRGYGLAMKEWNKSYHNAEEVTKEGVVGRWRDFRIATKTGSSDINMEPQTLMSDGSTPRLVTSVIDEWQNALSYNTAGSSRDFGIKSDANTFGIIEEYDKQGLVQADPSTATGAAAYGELQADLHNTEVANLQLSGNLPPYDADSSTPGSVLEYVGTICIDSSNGIEKRSTGFFDAPLGAVFVVGTAGTVDSIRQPDDQSVKPRVLKVTVQAGDYKGVKAHEYVDVKKLE